MRGHSRADDVFLNLLILLLNNQFSSATLPPTAKAAASRGLSRASSGGQCKGPTGEGRDGVWGWTLGSGVGAWGVWGPSCGGAGEKSQAPPSVAGKVLQRRGGGRIPLGSPIRCSFALAVPVAPLPAPIALVKAGLPSPSSGPRRLAHRALWAQPCSACEGGTYPAVLRGGPCRHSHGASAQCPGHTLWVASTTLSQAIPSQRARPVGLGGLPVWPARPWTGSRRISGSSGVWSLSPRWPMGGDPEASGCLSALRPPAPWHRGHSVAVLS